MNHPSCWRTAAVAAKCKVCSQSTEPVTHVSKVNGEIVYACCRCCELCREKYYDAQTDHA